MSPIDSRRSAVTLVLAAVILAELSVPLPAAATMSLPSDRFATGTAVFGMARQVGAAIGVPGGLTGTFRGVNESHPEKLFVGPGPHDAAWFVSSALVGVIVAVEIVSILCSRVMPSARNQNH